MLNNKKDLFLFFNNNKHKNRNKKGARTKPIILVKTKAIIQEIITKPRMNLLPCFLSYFKKQ